MVNTGLLLTQALNGIVLGLIFVLVALGLTIIFGTLGIVNFAHGDLLLLGAYITWLTYSATGIFLLGILIGGITVGILGAVIELTTLRRIYDYDPTLQLLLTFGLAELLRGAVILVWGRSGKELSPPDWLGGSVEIAGIITYPKYRLTVILTGILLILSFYYLLNKTDTGLIIRAGTQDRQMVQALGIDISNIFMLVFALGAAVAAVAGGLIGPIRGVDPQLGIDLLIPSFVVVVVGGIGSFKGSVVAGLLIGMAVVMTGVVYSSASQLIIYILMAVILVIRPRGLFGEKGVVQS
jgi:branched-subunit amino acid ABC-type transport system permease component